jgi:hypothetical protein
MAGPTAPSVFAQMTHRNIAQGASSTSFAVEAVTDVMIFGAAMRGNLFQLGLWAKQGVRVTTGLPMCAVFGGCYLEVAIFLVQELGADINLALRQPGFNLG